MAGSGAGPRRIDTASPRLLFAELVEQALACVRVEPTPLAAAYLVELLEQRLREAPPAAPVGFPAAGLAAPLLQERGQGGAERLSCLRSLGDGALFVAGFFGDSLDRSPLERCACCDAGRLAYAELAAALASGWSERPWADLFEELADRFGDFAEVLTEVGDASRGRGAEELERLRARWLRRGEERDRRRLLRRGQVAPLWRRPGWLQ